MTSMSSEISDLESFIDSYVTFDQQFESPTSSSTTNLNENGFPTSVQSEISSTQNLGTEMWGQKSSGNDWHASKSEHDWHDFRPKVQERSLYWQQQMASEQPQQLIQGHQQQLYHEVQPPRYPSPYDGSPYPHNYSSSQDTQLSRNQIPVMVNSMIEQNNMIQRNNLPPWIDPTQPPPVLPNSTPPSFTSYPSPFEEQSIYYDPRYTGQEQVLQSMTFQRAEIPPSNSPVVVNNLEYSDNSSWMFNNNMVNPMMMNAPMPSMPPVVSEPTHAPVSSYQQYHCSDSGQLDFHAELLQGGHFERPEGFSMGTYHQQITPQPQVNINKNLPNFNETSSVVKEKKPSPKHSPVKTNPQQNKGKYPNSRLPGSRGSGSSLSDEPLKHVTGSTNENEEVFDREPDGPRKNQKSHSQLNKKKAINPRNHKQSSIENDQKPKSTAQSRKTGKQPRERQDVSHGNKQEESKDKPRKQDNKTNNQNKKDNQPRRVVEREKGKVLSWLKKDQRLDSTSVGSEIRRLEISDTEADLSRFIEMTQSFATTEVKMREVAEIICNKALKETRFCRNASILCDRMAFMMVHGTKFRSVILNVMQGHYKNREQLYLSSYRKNRRWFGFITFLIEIFLNVRTSSRDRLHVLIDPVFKSLLQVLNGSQIDKEHVECFGRLFQKVGPSLEAESFDRLNQLVAETRDRCVMSKSPCVKRVLLRCVELYASKWKEIPT